MEQSDDKEKKEKKTKKKGKEKESESPQMTNKTTKQERKSNINVRRFINIMYLTTVCITLTMLNLIFCREALAGGFNPGDRVNGRGGKSKE